MKPLPLILNSLDDAGRRLTRIDSKAGDLRNEEWLQELLYSHPELLPVDAFDGVYSPVVPIGREVGTGRGPIDNLYVSPEGGITIVETKLWRNPEKHRTVVAQVIDYAKELATWNYDQLCTAVLTSSRRRGEDELASLEAKMTSALVTAGIELHEFQENVAACLLEGNFLLLIVGDRVSPNIALLTNAIQAAPGLGFRLGLVEMQLYQTTPGKDWPLIIVPEVVGRTVEKTRGVVQVRYHQEKPNVTVEVDEEETQRSGPAGKLDLDLFLREVPKDLVQPFKEGAEEWTAAGGVLHFTSKMMYFEADLNGQRQRVVRCRSYQVSIIRRQFLEDWGAEAGLFESYLASLDASPVVAEHVRDDRMWISYDKLSSNDLRALLRATTELVQRIKAQE